MENLITEKIASKKNIKSFSIAFGITLIIPWVVHVMGLFMNLSDPTFLGKTFLPMHIGVFIGAMMFGPVIGGLVGLLAPITSMAVTGMPIASPFPMVQIMTIELMVYGLVSGFVYQKSKKEYLSLVLGMISGRAILFLILSMGLIGINNPNFSSFSFIKGGIATGGIGLLIQLIMIPIIIKKINKK
ncbi:MAG: ECF transporter S component [Fusobacteriota bacterium]